MSKETLCPLQLSNLMDEIKFRMSYLFLNYAGLDILPITHLVSFIKPRLNVNFWTARITQKWWKLLMEDTWQSSAPTYLGPKTRASLLTSPIISLRSLAAFFGVKHLAALQVSWKRILRLHRRGLCYSRKEKGDRATGRKSGPELAEW